MKVRVRRIKARIGEGVYVCLSRVYKSLGAAIDLFGKALARVVGTELFLAV